MDLLLWRHAEAEEGVPDLARPLTVRGQRQAQAMAAWINTYAPQELRIVASPAVRTRQTVEALARPFSCDTRIGPAADVADLLAVCAWPVAASAVLLVGHQPLLGRLAALLLSGEETDWSVRKGGLWWLSRRVRGARGQTVLRAVLSPEMLP